MHKYSKSIAAVALLMVVVAGIALGQDPEPTVQPTIAEETCPTEGTHPAFGAEHKINLTVEANVFDIPKLESKAIGILTEKSGLTLAEAVSKVRVDDQTDVARCLELLFMDVLHGIQEANVVGTTIPLQHPQPSVN